MKMKKILVLLLTFCLVVSLISPAAHAVEVTSENAAGNKVQQGSSAATGKNWWQNLIASAADALGIRTLRDDQLNVNVQGEKPTLENGQWVVTAVDGTKVALKDAELPAHIQALKKAAESIGATDKVAAFVVLEQAPSVERYTAILEVPADETAQMEQSQEQLLDTLEEQMDLSLVAQFTYLTNAVVIETAFGNLESIAAMDGVKSVFLSPVYNVCETNNVVYPNTVSSTQMTGVSTVWQDLGYTGTGMTVAILDTGLDLDHPSFADAPRTNGDSWTKAYVQQLLDTYDLNAELMYGDGLSADDIYYSEKIPFYFNYAMGTTNVSHNDGIGDHGTHVAGISAANNVEGTGVTGMAPDAQIIAMKVFDSTTGGANMYSIIRAIEDCLTMGVDVVNMSLGSPAGFSSSGIEEIDLVYQRVSTTDLILDVAAGNEATSSYASSYGYYMQPTQYIDNATVSSPATYVNTICIGSVDNALVPSDFFKLNDGTSIFYMQSVEYLYGYINFTLTKLAGNDFHYVVIDGLGAPEDFYDENGSSLVKDKVAVIRRGELTFGEKVANAEAAGAVAAIIWNSGDEDIFTFGMTTTVTDADGNETYPGIPAILISREDGQKMADAANKILTVPKETGYRVDPAGGQMSSFSCWGVAPDLSLLPDFCGVGGNVYSCYDGGNYGVMSGTSMATPQVAGVTALVKQYLKEKFPDATTDQMRALINSLMMSTAVPVVDKDTGVESSPRQQGSGLVNALGAITAEAYLTVPGNERPKAEMGDSEEGVFTFTFTVHNFSGASKTYTLSSSLLCEDYVTDDAYPGIYFLAEEDRALDNSAVTFSANTVTVPAGGSKEISVTIRLTDADKNWIDTYFSCGNYVEGFIYLEGEKETTLSLPFLGFYGSWDESPVFDSGFWYQSGLWLEDYDRIEMNEYYHMLWTSLGSSTQDWLFGLNPYTGAQYEYDAEGNPISVLYNEKNNVLSPNGDGVLDQISDMYLSLMRNAQWIRLTYTDAEGNVLDVEELDKNAKTMYISGYGGVVPMVYSWYYDSLYDFTDENGNTVVKDGDVVYLSITGEIDYEGAREQLLVKMPVYIDTVAPKLDADSVVESTDENGNYLTLTFEDAHPAYLAVMNFTGTQIYDRYSDEQMTANGDGTYSITIDVTGLGDNFTVVLCDYGCNEAYYQMSYTLTDNAPEVHEETLYAYQVYNEEIYRYYGWDYMFGWSTINKDNAVVEMISSDAYEYYALTAAEYAGGYVFAVDAGYNFLYMIPGLFNRNLICNLGINVTDMAFDEKTQTMYLSAKTGDEYGLYTVDLLTGELTLLKTYESYFYMPWAMTFVDGELYCCKYYYNGFFKVDIAGGTYELQQVTLENGDKFLPVTATGSNTSPYYSQSMTYSPMDGLIYWAYYDGTESCLITIDPENWTSKAAAFASNQEYVGLLTVEKDGYTLPESTEITRMLLDKEQLVMAVGERNVLSAVLLPWNAPAGQVTWTSSDESVASVDATGAVLAHKEGEAVITATYGALSASCNVVVVDVSGSFYAYNYYSGTGDFGGFISVDMDKNSYENLFASPVDFIAADYNGHEKMIYGYDESGFFYSCDPATGKCVNLGKSDNGIPADMAYDYSTGLMYAVVYDYNTMRSTIYAVSTTSGRLIRVASVSDVFITLACSTDGVLYGLNYNGQLYELNLTDGKLEASCIMQTPVGSLFYAQSMCYDHVNDVLLWTSVENATVYWLGIHSEQPYCLEVGDPSGSGNIEYVGMYVIPTQIPDLAYPKVTGAAVDDMIMLLGDTRSPSITIAPTNASKNYTVTYTSTDTDVIEITADGKLKAVGLGTATVRARVTGDVSGRVTDSFEVTVKKSTGGLNGFLLSDLANMDGYYWIGIDDSDPRNYEGIDYVFHNGQYLLLYAAEYVDGYIYAYGFNYDDWEANFQYLIINAKTWSVLEAYDMGSDFGFVYDMAFDYTTGTMYALMDPSDTSTDLYYVNLENGQLIDCMITEPLFMSLAIDGNGTIYAMEASAGDSGELSSGEIGNAILYTLDPVNGTCKPFMDTGFRSNMLSSMAYDFDTGYIYWTGLLSTDAGYESGLYLLDLEEEKTYNLGAIGNAGAQVTALMVFSDNYPQVPDTLQKAAMMSSLEQLAVGGQVQLDTFIQPAGLDVTHSWASDNTAVAAVDANGVVTAVAPGTATVTVTITDAYGNVKTARCVIVVFGEEDHFITYNATDSGFTAIYRPDSSVVKDLTTGETDAPVSSMAIHEGVIYAYDTEGNLFITAADAGFSRHYIGSHGIESPEPEEKHSNYAGNGYTYGYDYTYTYDFVVRDMQWDEANDRLLVLGCSVQNYEIYYWYESAKESTRYLYASGQNELVGGCKLFEADLQTGALTELIQVGSDNDAGVTMFAIDDEGQAYVYSFFMDYISKMDMQTGELTALSTFQNQGFYGDSDGQLMAMTYDPITDDLYILITANGKVYYLYSFDTETYVISRVNTVGPVISYNTDSYRGLVLNEEHSCTYEVKDTKTATCTEPGYITYGCAHGVTYSEEIPATGHHYEVTDSKDVTCTEDGHVTYACACGDTYTETTPATGHNHAVTDSKEATCTEDGHVTYTCSCGDSYTETIPAIGHSYENGVCTGCGSIQPGQGGNAQTGDTMSPIWVLVLLMISAGGMTVLLMDRKKRLW